MTSKLTSQLSFLALLVDVYRSRCLRPVSRWSPLMPYIRLLRLGCTTAAPPLPRPRCCSWSPPWCWTRPGVWAGLVSGAGVCRVSRLHAPLPLCCCNLVSWSPTDCSLRPEAAAESSQLLPPPAALQHGRSCHELHSEAANPITHNLAVPSIGAKSETRQGKYNRLNYFYGCSCGRNYSERMPRCFGGVL